MSKIAIMGAMPEEIEPLLAKVEDIKKVEYANNSYYEAKYKGKELVIAYSKIGKVFSSLTASTLLEKFSCDKLLFSGVAGAINPELKIGDLIIADKLCQHDLDISIFGHDFGFVPEGAKFVESDEGLRSIAKEVAKDNELTLIEGTIATGDQFVASNERKEFISKNFQADALEMEGASVAVVCDALNVPFFILRAISDTANDDAGMDFDEFMVSSAKISAAFILDMVEKID
ncbi:MAG: Menaquinone via 6-amino-6-deoxyfutalosine step 2 [uncultured Sulfurovum sp.]|uniref:adenosylhomocysteine nucleosidase n=1 Tax=uncultured Sulfurovum sp. TaxID=269237 RepID=A0A6S6SVE5_9BACT|nr:MAG: Menaquinone via 6-amino-6-deoxyfutalosine step 2 [uncultured Sulfurovum sp.]